MKKLTFSFIIMFLSLVSLKAESFTIYFMPYGPTASQIIYVSNKTDTQYILRTKRVVDEKQNIYLQEYTIMDLKPKTVTKVAPTLNQMLEQEGFLSTRAKIEFEVGTYVETTDPDTNYITSKFIPAPKGTVSVHAAYTAGSVNGYSSTYLVDNAYLPYSANASQIFYVYNESDEDITSYELEAFDDKGQIYILNINQNISSKGFVKASPELGNALLKKGFTGGKVLIVSKTENVKFHVEYNAGSLRRTSMHPFNMGVTNSNSSSNSLKSTDVEAMPSGWTLAGTSSELDATDVLKSAKMGWIWKDGKWHVHSTADGFKDKVNASSFDTFDKIPANSGFWIMK